jgi:hypothetical protein
VQKTLTPAQQRTLPARQALEAKFISPEEKSEHFRALARRSHERRLTLSGDEAATLAQVSDFLRRLVERDQHPHDPRTVRKAAASVA